MFNPNTEKRILNSQQTLKSTGSKVALSRLIRCKFAPRRIYLYFSIQILPLRISP